MFEPQRPSIIPANVVTFTLTRRVAGHTELEAENILAIVATALEDLGTSVSITCPLETVSKIIQQVARSHTELSSLNFGNQLDF